MRVLQILGGEPWGGRAASVRAIIRAQVLRGDEVWVVARDRLTARRFEAVGARVANPPLWLGPLQPLDIVPFLYLFALCRQVRFGLVVTHTPKAGLLGRIAARLAGVPRIVHHAHSLSFHLMKPGLRRRLRLAVERLAARAGDLIISTSEEHRRSALREQVERPERILTIASGVELPRPGAVEEAAARRDLGFEDSELIVGSVGWVGPGRGYEYLLQAMPTILARHPSARLVIEGKGPLKDELRQEAVLMGLEDRVCFLAPRGDTVTLVSGFNVFVQPCLRLASPMSLLEAMGTGRAIVACNIPGNRELLDDGDTALLVPPANARALALAICHMLDDAARAREFGLRARQAVARRFSLERMVEQNLQAYRRRVDQISLPGRAGQQIVKGAVAGRSMQI